MKAATDATGARASWDFSRIMQRRRFTSTAFLAAALAWTGCAEVTRRSGSGADLNDLVGELLPAVERLSGLRALSPVTVELTDPVDVQRYVESRLDTYLPGEQLEGMRRTYVMLGLLPDTLDLRSLLLELYGEQVAGFYDPVTRVLYVVESEAAGPIEPVLAHELVHAIQDQHVNLDSLIMQRGANDRQTAAQAAIEGHATLAMFAWVAESTTGDTVDPAMLPDPGAGIAGMFAGTDQFPVFRSAPRIIREALLFPYASGASFVQALWRDRSGERPAPFGELLPASTEQVLDPRIRFLNGRDEPTEVRHGEIDDWVVRYDNTLGAFETGIFVDEVAGSGIDASRGWDGDRITLYESPSGAALVWTSVWDDATAADLFADRVAGFSGGPGRAVLTIRRIEVEGRAAVRIAIGDDNVRPPDPGVYCVATDGEPVAC